MIGNIILGKMALHISHYWFRADKYRRGLELQTGAIVHLVEEGERFGLHLRR